MKMRGKSASPRRNATLLPPPPEPRSSRSTDETRISFKFFGTPPLRLTLTVTSVPLGTIKAIRPESCRISPRKVKVADVARPLALGVPAGAELAGADDED